MRERLERHTSLGYVASGLIALAKDVGDNCSNGVVVQGIVTARRLGAVWSITWQPGGMSLSGSALVIATRLGLKALTQFIKANEFDRLCELLARRFASRLPRGAADYAEFLI